MHETEYKILSVFKENSSKQLSTSQIVELVFQEEWNEIRNALDNKYAKDKAAIFKAKRLKAQLHRRVLYYLSKLIAEDILKITKEGTKGEKFYTISLHEDEEFIIEKYKRKIIISKPALPAMPMEGYEQRNLVTKFEGATWIDRVNSIVMEASSYRDLAEAEHNISRFFSNINDSIAINHFETLLNKASIEEVHEFYLKIENECADYGRLICFIIDTSNISPDNQDKILAVLSDYSNSTHKTHNVGIVFEITIKDIQSKRNFFKDALSLISTARIKVFFKNKELCKQPYLIGQAGPYTFNEEEWKECCMKIGNGLKNIICGQSTVVVDVAKFQAEQQSFNQFRAFVLNITKSLLSANALQRRGSGDYFKDLLTTNIPFEKDTFAFSRNFIRFWNYGWKQEGVDQNLLVDIFSNVREDVDKFCLAEETIYLACGMPTRFRIAFASAFRTSSVNAPELSDAKYKRTYISKLDELYSDESLKSIRPKEKLFKIFDGGDCIIFHRIGDSKPENVLRELNVILSTYDISFFGYDFGESHKGDLKLTNFFE